MNLKDHIRGIPDFPVEGILFYDIATLLRSPEAMEHCLRAFESAFEAAKPDVIAGIESRGFLFAVPLAQRLGLPMMMIRKAGKLPGPTRALTYELEYGTAELEMHLEDLKAGMKTLIVDDLIATGGTLKASCELVEELKGQVMGVFGVIGLPFLNYGSVLDGYDVKTLINYDSE